MATLKTYNVYFWIIPAGTIFSMENLKEKGQLLLSTDNIDEVRRLAIEKEYDKENKDSYIVAAKREKIYMFNLCDYIQ